MRPPWWGMLIMWEAMLVWGQEAYGNIYVLCSQHYCEPKNALKIAVNKEKEDSNLFVVEFAQI